MVLVVWVDLGIRGSYLTNPKQPNLTTDVYKSSRSKVCLLDLQVHKPLQRVLWPMSWHRTYIHHRSWWIERAQSTCTYIGTLCHNSFYFNLKKSLPILFMLDAIIIRFINDNFHAQTCRRTIIVLTIFGGRNIVIHT